jgi:hypothetical protein
MWYVFIYTFRKNKNKNNYFVLQMSPAEDQELVQVPQKEHLFVNQKDFIQTRLTVRHFIDV